MMWQLGIGIENSEFRPFFKRRPSEYFNHKGPSWGSPISEEGGPANLTSF